LSGTDVSEIAIRSFVIAALVAIGVSCTAHYPESPTPTPTLAGLQLHYPSPLESILPGTTTSLILYAINSEGVYEDVSTRANWSSGNPSVFTSMGNGNVRGVSNGTSHVIATYQGLSTTATIVVGGRTGLDVSIPFIGVGETRQATAAVTLQNRIRMDVTSRSTWTSSDPSIVTVEAGNITAHGPGSASITARFETFGSATVYLSVPPIRSLP
jgi:Bacterial Ig-like domain (group 2)